MTAASTSEGAGNHLESFVLLSTEDNSEPGYVFVSQVPLLCGSCDMAVSAHLYRSLASNDLTNAEEADAQLQIHHPLEANIHFNHDQCVTFSNHGGCQDPTNDWINTRIVIHAHENALQQFQAYLNTNEYQEITNPASFTDVLAALIACKNAQSVSKAKLRKHQHLDRLLQRVHHYKEVVDVAVQGCPDTVSFIWASMRFLIMVRQFYALPCPTNID